MSANVESMFYVRETPWHGLGVRVEEALTAEEALGKAGLGWVVCQHELKTVDGISIEGYKANIRSTDDKVLGIVSDRYKIVQNQEAFAFTDALIGEGVRYETAGSLASGKKVWMLAKLPQDYKILGEEVDPFLLFSNTHDGSGAIRVAITPVRVVCQNTLNIALKGSNRQWSTIHTGNIDMKMEDAKRTLMFADHYLKNLSVEAEKLHAVKITDDKITEFINDLFIIPENAPFGQSENVIELRNDLRYRYFEAPDLKVMDKSLYRLLNAVSDLATHSTAKRNTDTYKENLFMKTAEGHPVIDKAYSMINKILIAA